MKKTLIIIVATLSVLTLAEAARLKITIQVTNDAGDTVTQEVSKHFSVDDSVRVQELLTFEDQPTNATGLGLWLLDYIKTKYRKIKEGDATDAGEAARAAAEAAIVDISDTPD